MLCLLQSVSFSGFYTEEVISPMGQRVGFDVVMVPEPPPSVDPDRPTEPLRTELARLAPKNHSYRGGYYMGKYEVFPHQFEDLVYPALRSPRQVLVLDEVGEFFIAHCLGPI